MAEQLSCSLAIVLAAAAAILGPLLTMMAAAGVGESWRNTKDEEAAKSGHKNEGPPSVPFFYVPPIKANCQDMLSAEPPFGDLLKSLDKYRMDTAAFLASLTRQHEVARRSEWIMYGNRGDSPGNPLLAAAYRDKIGRIAECLENDYVVLEGLMQPFDVTIGLPSSEGEMTVEDILDHGDDRDQNHNDSCTNEEADETRYTTVPGRRRGNDDGESSYDSAAQIVTHVVRDWSEQGQSIRRSLYTWCVDMVEIYHFKEDNKRFVLPILIPGSGLGRLAYELSTAGYSVEANDVSISMAAVASKLWNNLAARSRNLHPFCFDFLVNEVDSGSRYDSVAFPDINVSPGERLSYTLGDFVTTYGSNQRKDHYGAVVTCFFIDTATNIYEYLAVISSALCSGGLWVNVGPVQWHTNAIVQPSGTELKMLVEGFGFEVLTWSVDTEGVNYRHDEDHKTRYTKAEAYLPIRFVARKQNAGGDGQKDAAQVIRDLREMTAVDHRISTGYATSSSVPREGTEGSKRNLSGNENEGGEDKIDEGSGFVHVAQDDERESVVIEELS